MTKAWGSFTWAEGFKFPDDISLEELAARSEDDLEHVINLLLNIDSDEAVDLAERLFDANVQ